MTHAVSGGGETLQDHRMFGANLEKDVAYQYLRFFLQVLFSIMELDSWNLINELGWGSTRENWEGVQEWGDAYHWNQEYSDWCVGWNDFNHNQKRDEVSLDIVNQFMEVRKLDF